ncbi:MAG TPA: hypothetical protein VFX33_00565 [Actinomycetales bacterium]|jgi:hypothetical protein|nr:hypothetical protein [Actinomycetales bacterium]
MQADRTDEQVWVGFFDPDGAWYHLVLAQEPGHHWDVAELDKAVSDPDGNFLVYVAGRSRQDIRISIKCEPGPSGVPLALHLGFDSMSFGSPTLMWNDIKRSTWWTMGSPWVGERPRTWRKASTSRDLWHYRPGSFLDSQ